MSTFHTIWHAWSWLLGWPLFAVVSAVLGVVWIMLAWLPVFL